MQPADARKYLAFLRMGIGGMWLVPGFGAKLFGLDAEGQSAVKLLARLFAVRDAALGVALLKASGADADRQVDLGIVIDAADLAAIVIAARRKEVGSHTLLLGGATAAAALGMGLLGRRLGR